MALMWLRVDTSVAAVGFLALVAWRWGRSSLLTKGGQLALLWLAYPVAILWLLIMLNASGGRRTEQSVILAYSVLGLAFLTTIIIKRKNAAPISPVAMLNGAGGKPRLKFKHVGGLEEAKTEIGKLIESRLDAKRYRKYGVVQNGILLHGPRGSGKTFLAEATAGQFGLHYE
jgi:type VI protein secretion system component VasK